MDSRQDFWNPKIRSPICFNPAAVRTYLPITLMKTKLVLAGKSKEKMFEAISASLDDKQLPALEPDAICYMMSKQQYLSDSAQCWHPHLMFFVPRATQIAGELIYLARRSSRPMIRKTE